MHLYSDLIQGALQRLCITLSDGGGNHAGHQHAHREQLGFRVNQGLFNTNSGGAWGTNWVLFWEPSEFKDGFLFPRASKKKQTHKATRRGAAGTA